MRDLQDIIHVNAEAKRRYDARLLERKNTEIRNRLQKNLDELAHKIARQATIGAVDLDLCLDYECTVEAIALCDGKKLSQQEVECTKA